MPASPTERRRKAQINMIRDRVRLEKLALSRSEECDTPKGRGRASISRRILDFLQDIEVDLLTKEKSK